MKKVTIFLMLLGLALAACGGGDETPASTSTPAPSAGGEGQKFTVDLNEWEIAPKDLQAKAGKISFDLKNTGKFPHSLAIDVNGTKQESKQLKGGETTTWEVDLKAGTYKTWCPVGNHESRGMVGELVVE